MSSEKSYVQVLKASSIMGGAAAINLLLGLLRVKYAAVLIGTAGVGLIASFTALQGVIGTLAGLGLQSSGVRDIAAAVAKGDDLAIGRTVLALRRISRITGLVGMAAMIMLAPELSQLTFGHREYTIDIAALGVIILFGNLSGGQMALIQGMRQIGDIARASIYGAAVGTAAAISLYAALGLRGIIPTLVAVSAIQLALSFYYARRVPVPQVTLTWRQTFAEAGSMVRLGLVLMWNGLLGSAVAYFTVTIITHYEGTEAVGLYSAAFALSGMFVNFVLGAMGADYFPRLTGVAHEKNAMVHMVNQQTEVAILLALPGLVATITFAPWILKAFYTAEFLGSIELLQWFILGCLGRLISWPLGFVMLALGKGRWYLLTETSFNLIHIALITVGLQLYGLEGVAVSFFVIYLCYIVAVFFVSKYLIGFQWTSKCIRIGITSFIFLALIFIFSRLLPLWHATWLGILLSLIASVLCLRGLIFRIGADHRLVRLFARLPVIKSLVATN